MSTDRSPHILGTSANLLGFCLIVLTSLKISRSGEETAIDDIASIASLLLVVSCVLSFLSMRIKVELRSKLMETIADIAFMTALVCIAATVVLVSLNVLK